MADTVTTTAHAAPTSKSGSGLTKKVGPLPVWAWGLLGGAVVGGAYYLHEKNSAAAGTASSSTASSLCVDSSGNVASCNGGCTDSSGNPIDCTSTDTYTADLVTTQFNTLEQQVQAIQSAIGTGSGDICTDTYGNIINCGSGNTSSGSVSTTSSGSVATGGASTVTGTGSTTSSGTTATGTTTGNTVSSSGTTSSSATGGTVTNTTTPPPSGTSAPAQASVYPAPTGLTLKHTGSGMPATYLATWNLITSVTPKPSSYTLAVYNSAGQAVVYQTVTVPDTSTAQAAYSFQVAKAGTYSVHVWANGGKQAPPHATASLKVT